MSQASCVHRARVDRHFDGTLPPEEERAMREHLPGCAACTARYERHLVLEQIDPDALGARDRIGRGLGFAEERAAGDAVGLPKAAPRWTRVAPLAVGALAAAAAALLFVGTRGDRRPDQGFQARGGDGTAGGAGLVVYRVEDGGLVAAGEEIRATSELAFAYGNPSAKKHMVIFAVDERRRVFWYHPAWTDEAQDPSAVAARAGEGPHTLGEAVRHPFDPGGRVRICSVFTDEPVTVRRVERALAELPDFARGEERAPDLSRALAGASATCTTFRVTP